MEELEQTHRDADHLSRSKRVELDRLELTLKEHEEKIRRLGVQLNTVKTNREYAAIEHEIATHKADASLIEDQVLAMLEEMDEAEAQRAARDDRLRSERDNLRATQAHVSRETAEIDAKTEQLQAARSEKTRRLDPELRSLYERLCGRRDGRAMVRATRLDGDNRACGGCYMRLTSNTTSLLLSAEELVLCHSCGRILYIDDQEDDAAEPSAGEGS